MLYKCIICRIIYNMNYVVDPSCVCHYVRGVSYSIWYMHHILYVVFFTYDIWYRLCGRYHIGYSIRHILDMVYHGLYMRVSI